MIYGRSIVLFLFLASHLSVSARADVLRELLVAKSVAELDANEISRTRHSEKADSCAAQLKMKAIPRDCFTSDLNSRPIELASLIRICIVNARASRSRLDLSRATERGSSVPDSCLRVLRERKDDLNYVDESQHPELSVMRTDGPDLEE